MLHIEDKVPRALDVQAATQVSAASFMQQCTSHLTPHTSHLTPHTSHLTPHTSRLISHTRCGSSLFHASMEPGSNIPPPSAYPLLIPRLSLALASPTHRLYPAYCPLGCHALAPPLPCCTPWQVPIFRHGVGGLHSWTLTLVVSSLRPHAPRRCIEVRPHPHPHVPCLRVTCAQPCASCTGQRQRGAHVLGRPDGHCEDTAHLWEAVQGPAPHLLATRVYVPCHGCPSSVLRRTACGTEAPQ
jgi:hypothetical protein